jgi:hypothetical protein
LRERMCTGRSVPEYEWARGTKTSNKEEATGEDVDEHQITNKIHT